MRPPEFADSLWERKELPIVRRLDPLGFPLELASNSEEVIAAATESWGECRLEFEREPVRVRVIVEPGGEGSPPEPVYRSQQGILAIVSDRDNFGACDLVSRCAWCQVSPRLVANRALFRWYFLDAMVYLLLSQRDIVLVHAACVAREDRGVLLCGTSGSGKTTLAYACARAGWTYLTDDATAVLQGSPERVALSRRRAFHFRPNAVDLFPELGRLPQSIHPNGKPTIEAPASALAGIASTSRCRLACIVFPDRRAAPGIQEIAPEEALCRLQREMPDFGEPARSRQEETLAHLVRLPTYELCYRTLSEAVALLDGLSVV
ncbi:MAG: hypothetical protein C5B51_05705 [Terriglobia bacterium]|nr:MAG: hypothetical protein C5B51_05705 [Terriglobia bacterium]